MAGCRTTPRRAARREVAAEWRRWRGEGGDRGGGDDKGSGGCCEGDRDEGGGDGGGGGGGIGIGSSDGGGALETVLDKGTDSMINIMHTFFKTPTKLSGGKRLLTWNVYRLPHEVKLLPYLWFNFTENEWRIGVGHPGELQASAKNGLLGFWE
ncbi:Protein of unknown function [Gryllus bimaculatus]|nr:Protein of unknown function [Gryllus bimaculatus]